MAKPRRNYQENEDSTTSTLSVPVQPVVKPVFYPKKELVGIEWFTGGPGPIILGIIIICIILGILAVMINGIKNKYYYNEFRL